MADRCETCDGFGSIIREIMVPGCCERPLKSGECCGNAVPVPEEEQTVCPDCYGSGRRQATDWLGDEFEGMTADLLQTSVSGGEK